MSNKEAISKSPSGRVQRSPVGVRNKLTVRGKDPEYHYRIVNDAEDRVQQFLDAGYEVVKDSEVKVGDKRVSSPSAEGSVAQVSVGGGMKGIVMRIKQDWYLEDQKAKSRGVDASEEDMKRKAIRGSDYGKFELGRE